jgi:hypothetical protein
LAWDFGVPANFAVAVAVAVAAARRGCNKRQNANSNAKFGVLTFWRGAVEMLLHIPSAYRAIGFLEQQFHHNLQFLICVHYYSCRCCLQLLTLEPGCAVIERCYRISLSPPRRELVFP